MSFKAALLGSLLAVAAGTNAAPTVATKPTLGAMSPEATEDFDTSEFYKDISSAGHSAKMLKTSNAQKKWVKFPEQRLAHAASLENKHRRLRAENKAKIGGVETDDFFVTHASTFGLTDKHEMALLDETPLAAATVRRRYDQFYDGVKVLTGDYVMSVGAHGGVLNAHGLTLSKSSVRQTPDQFKSIKERAIDTDSIHTKVKDAFVAHRSQPVTASRVSEITAKMAEDYPGFKGFKVKDSAQDALPIVNAADISLEDVKIELVVHPQWLGADLTDSSLAYSVSGLARMPGEMVGFQVLLDADSLGSRLFVDKTSRFSVRNARDYNVAFYTAESIGEPLDLVWRTRGGGSTTGYSEAADLIVDVTMQTANLMYSLTGGSWLTYNPFFNSDLNAVLASNFSNAAYYAGGIFMGSELVSDDVVAHEWGHAYTENMNDLFYFEDSGALNEAFSDILGESIDILNGDSSAEPRKYVNCSFSSSERWLMGEDTSYGAIRDMNTPECFGDPSSLRNPLYAFHWCFDYMDGYGVHTNSGVMNKIFSVMTDGGFQIQYSKRMGFQNVVYSQGISLEKALNVVGMGYSYLNQFSNYQDAAVAIEESCEDLLTAAPFVPVINRRSVKASKPLVAYMCNRVRTIMKRANLYDDPIDDDVCDFFMGPS